MPRRQAAPRPPARSAYPRSRSPRASACPFATVRKVEIGRRAPQEPARALLRIIDRAPETTFQAPDRT